MQGRRTFYKPIKRGQRGAHLTDGRQIRGVMKYVDTAEHLTTIPVGALRPYETVLVYEPFCMAVLQDISNPHDLGSWELMDHPWVVQMQLLANLELLQFKNELVLDFVDTHAITQGSDGDPVAVATAYNDDFDTLDDKWKLDAWIKSSEEIPAGSEVLMTKGGNPLGEAIVLEEPISEIWLSELMGMINPDASVRSSLVDANNSTVEITVEVQLPVGSDNLTTNITAKVMTSDDDFEHVRVILATATEEVVFEALPE